jgi:hypothetical protein
MVKQDAAEKGILFDSDNRQAKKADADRRGE